MPGELQDERKEEADRAQWTTNDGPTCCANRTYAEDVEEAARGARAHLELMDTERLAILVKARQTAAGLAKVYPGGDQRFVDLESESGEEEEAEEDGGVVEEEQCVGLLDNTVDSGPRETLERAKREYGFDLLGLMRESNLPFLERIKLVNYIRSLIKKGVAPKTVTTNANDVAMKKENATSLKEDSWLKPIIPEDPLLTALDDDANDESSLRSETCGGKDGVGNTTTPEDELSDIAARVERLLPKA
eukprot:Plantae.Rhodophyta-Hildenbrandia_rubra.ctg34373.p1 GENE.Plantae.Rhodophyta-Hildenbrandia_rubra.ctg34373~~Plantae.Rhodophyta-Hildenbrandia_rubra.ctg34373.p1  ORF type:complete len:247 (+),score=57.49 Plantae.Rhodophyta-Hildenbrandia_rubra.ctg34373:382-1122(+)